MNVGESPTSVPWERALTQRAVTDVSVEREEDTMLTGSSAQVKSLVLNLCRLKYSLQFIFFALP